MIHFGTGPIRGFGTTLLAGLIIQMFTALFVTKAVFGLWIKKGWMTTMHVHRRLQGRPLPLDDEGPSVAARVTRPHGLMTVVLFADDRRLEVRPRLHGRHYREDQARRRRRPPAEVQDVIDGIKGVDGNQKYKERDVILRTNVPGAEGDRSPEFDLKLRSESPIDDAQVKDFIEDHLNRMFPGHGFRRRDVVSPKPGEWKVEFAFKAAGPGAADHAHHRRLSRTRTRTGRSPDR